MADYRIVYWRGIPSQVIVKDESDEIRTMTPKRFQDAIDELMSIKRGMSTTSGYKRDWVRNEDLNREGAAQAVADAIIAEIETEFTADRVAQLVVEAQASDQD